AKVGTRRQVIIDEIGPTVAKGRSKATRRRSTARSMWRAVDRCGSARSPPCASSAPTNTDCTAPPEVFEEDACRHRRAADCGWRGLLCAAGEAPRLWRLVRPRQAHRRASRHWPGRLGNADAAHDAERCAGLPGRARPECETGLGVENLPDAGKRTA